jgi:hypothetical protein
LRTILSLLRCFRFENFLGKSSGLYVSVYIITIGIIFLTDGLPLF